MSVWNSLRRYSPEIRALGALIATGALVKRVGYDNEEWEKQTSTALTGIGALTTAFGAALELIPANPDSLSEEEKYQQWLDEGGSPE